MSYGYWKKYVPVAKRRAKAQSHATKVGKDGEPLEPVVVNSRSIANTFWGKAWCNNLEAYSDYSNRLPRARTYVRNGSVIDLKILPGKIMAQVLGSSRYHIEINIKPMATPRWNELVKDCTGSIESLVELLQGHLSESVMQRICAPKTGLFPSPTEITFTCSCPDWAAMCKHVGATLYGVGARLDTEPQLLFALRQVDANDLLNAQTVSLNHSKNKPSTSRVLSDDALSDVFGIDMAVLDEPIEEAIAETPTRKRSTRSSVAKKATPKKAVVKKAATKKSATSAAAPKKSVAKDRSAQKSGTTQPRRKRSVVEKPNKKVTKAVVKANTKN